MEREVKDITPTKNVSDLVEQMYESGGFMAKHVGVAARILKEMLEKADLRFLSFPACIIATGTRGIIKEFLRKRLFDVVITTCGTWDHDLARSFKPYYHGSFFADDKELHKRGIYRLGNIFIPHENYAGIIEEKMAEILEGKEGSFATYEISWMIGEKLHEDSLLYWAYKNKIPVIVPAPYDGAVGYQIWQYQQTRKFTVDIKKDESLIADLVWNSKVSGALMIGGGISKHHVIWWNQFKDGLDYTVFITTATEYDGSLSGARTREAISWGKIKEEAKHITVQADATVVLPLLASFL